MKNPGRKNIWKHLHGFSEQYSHKINPAVPVRGGSPKSTVLLKEFVKLGGGFGVRGAP